MVNKVVIFDLDGTLANIEHRLKYLDERPKNWKAFEESCHLDKPKEDIIALAKTFARDNWTIIICSGRSDKVIKQTKKWLADNEIYYSALLMRKEGDYRHDTVIKKEMLDYIIQTWRRPDLVVDDRMSVVNMWREQGLTCLQCELWDDSGSHHSAPYTEAKPYDINDPKITVTPYTRDSVLEISLDNCTDRHGNKIRI